MRLILVHGINQQGAGEAVLKDAWLGHLAAGLGRPLGQAEVLVPFYGDRLAALSDGHAGGAVAQGPGGQTDTGEAGFLAAALTEQAQAAGATAAMIAAEERRVPGEAVEEGFPMNRRINALVRVLERASPLHGSVVMRLLPQAYAYLKRPAAGAAVDAIVRPILDAGPAIVVGHSLGTVVTFKLLRQLALENRALDVPLYVTLGSPLPLMAVQAALGPAFAVPRGVGRWLNAVDPDDFIALGRGLDGLNFAEGIDNILDIENVPGDAHAIEGYLRDPRVAAAIAQACGI
ncbi:hypothetical protein [Methylobacterium aquaticum]|uniref:Alpha/beta hydrolase n=1 Tax=Methylobacterium aquaticum TaxID=270351 RepID=A0A0J6S3Q8_9HYPH|nr:hypothetical protein [Methylobacterium aquaticum]KMO29830.1 hypothetical protein VP06_23500 [Methylobacterium aquaticum]